MNTPGRNFGQLAIVVVHEYYTIHCFLVSALMSSAITVNVVHAAVTGAFATTAKGLLRNALRGGTPQKLLQFCLLLRKNRWSRHSLTQLKAAATEKKPPRWYMTFLSQFHALYCLLRRMALPYSNCGSGYNWGIMSCRQRRKVGVLGQCNTKQESIHHRAGLAAHNLWNTMHRRQVCIWFDNLRRYRSGGDPHSPDLTLNCTAVTRVPKVADDIFRSHRALFDRIDVAKQGIQRVWVHAPLDIARKNVRSLNWRPFFLSELRSGTHKELLQLVVDLSCVEHRTRHCVPLLVDMKIHFALLKLCYGAAYVPGNVPQLLLGFPLVYGIWHSYKYCVELIYRAFLPFIKFLEQGNSLQVGSILPRKVKVIHMEKTLLGLMLATSSNRGKLDERFTSLLNSQRDLTPIQRKGLRMLLALKALLYTYCLAAFSIGTLVRECNWEGRGAGSGVVAKQALEMSLLLMLNILKPEEQLTTEYVKTTAVALLFWSQWHSASLGCIHSEELGEALLSRFSAHCRRNSACTSVQQSSDLFLTLPPVQPGEKVLRGVLTERSVAMFSANLNQFILRAHTQSLPICVPVPDYKVEVRRLDAVEDLTFPGTMSRTRITTDRLKVVLLHAMQNLVARTRVAEAVEDFLQTNAPARTAAEQGVLRTAHASIRAANRAPPTAAAAAPGGIALLPKPGPKPRARGPPVPPPRPPPAQYPPPPALDDSIAVDSCDSDQDIDCDADSVASFEALDEAEHIGVDTQDWD